jgi:hypothetical protein
MIPGMRRMRGIVVILLIAAGAGCTSSGAADAPTAGPVSSPPAGSVSVGTASPAPSSPAPTSSPSTAPTTSRPPARPTVPADVPTTGPNLRTKDERPPVEPVAALAHTRAGANAFAKFFIRTIDWAYATTSTTYMRHYFESSCAICRGLASQIDRDRRRHLHFIGDRITIRRANSGRMIGKARTVTVSVDVTSVEVVDRRKSFVSGQGALSSYRERIHLRWLEHRWIVTRLDALG